MIKAKTIALAIPRENRRVALAVLSAIGATIAENRKEQDALQNATSTNEAGVLPPDQFPPARIERLRRAVVQEIWEPDLRSELVDRCVKLVATGIVTASELRQAIALAKEKRRIYEETGGLRGSESAWKPLGAWCKEKFENAGVVWTKTDKRLEPKPNSPKPVALRAVDFKGAPIMEQ